MKTAINRASAGAGRTRLASGTRSFSRPQHGRIGVGRSGDAGTEKGLHARRLQALRRRNPQRPSHRRLPAAAACQSQRCLQGGVRAVRGGCR